MHCGWRAPFSAPRRLPSCCRINCSRASDPRWRNCSTCSPSRSSVVGTERVRPDTREGSHFIGVDLATSAIASTRALVHVPPIGTAFESLATAGRFVFTAAAWSAFDHAVDVERSGSPLVAAIRNLIVRERVFACVIEGRRLDCGGRLGYLEAQVAFARQRPELWTALQRGLETRWRRNRAVARDYPIRSSLHCVARASGRGGAVSTRSSIGILTGRG